MMENLMPEVKGKCNSYILNTLVTFLIQLTPITHFTKGVDPEEDLQCTLLSVSAPNRKQQTSIFKTIFQDYV